MRTALLILLAFAAQSLPGVASADSTVWKWVDDRGVVHYSDQPVPGATRIEVKAGNIAQGRTEDEEDAAQPPPAADTGGAAAAPVTSYRNFEIWRPENDQVIPNSGGQVNVEIRIEPAVQGQHTLNLYLDGKLVTGFPRNTLSYALSGVGRGTHNVTATVSDRAGKTIQETRAVVFIVRQESVANPPVGPAQRPPPKPRTGKAVNKLPSSQPSYNALNGGRPAIDPATNRPIVKKPAPKPGKP
jgi:Domain of unknown function (DUF4124)